MAEKPTYEELKKRTSSLEDINIALMDITESKQAEEELEKYREHLEELVEDRTSELKEKMLSLNV